MISTSGILSTGEKKCRPMKSSGRFTPSASPVIGSVEVLEHEQRVGLDDVLDLGEHLVLERRVLEDRLDDEVAAREVGGVGGRGDPGQQLRRGFSSVVLPRETALSSSFSE